MVIYGPTSPSLPPAPPAGVDAPIGNGRTANTLQASDASFEQSLWGVLTEEERQFFAQQAELGPLTYGPRGAQTEQVDVPKGQRLDVRG